MKYYNSKTIKGSSFLDVKKKIIDALKTEGFGVLTEIDLKETMKNKLGKVYLPHTILGACNPTYADKVLSIDAHTSVILPCNVTIRELENGEIEVSSINPSAAMSAIGDDKIIPIANEVQAKLLNVLNLL
jgi:uncharacterized protein (DUF302 family)